jgi:hypothetical protein
MVLVGAQFLFRMVLAPAPPALEVAEPAGGAAVELGEARPLPAPLAQVQVLVQAPALQAESPGVLEPKLANMGSIPVLVLRARLTVVFEEKLAADRGMVQSQ